MSGRYRVKHLDTCPGIYVCHCEGIRMAVGCFVLVAYGLAFLTLAAVAVGAWIWVSRMT